MRSRLETELFRLLDSIFKRGTSADMESDTEGVGIEKPSYVEVVFKTLSLSLMVIEGYLGSLVKSPTASG